MEYHKFVKMLDKYVEKEWFRDDLTLTREHREKDPCFYCGRTTKLSWDHIVPQAKGGKDFCNLTRACRKCNSKKASLNLLEFMVYYKNPMYAMVKGVYTIKARYRQ